MRVEDKLNRELIGTILCLVLSITFSCCTDIMDKRFNEKYNVIATAELKEVNEDTYLAAPYHGGRIKEETDYIYKYQWVYNDISYTWTYRSVYPINVNEVAVRFNSEDPTVVYYDKSNINETNSEDWRRCYLVSYKNN